MYRFVLYLALLILSTPFFSCGKYEDGPLFSLASRKGRVVNEWNVERYFENNQDVTNDFFEAYVSFQFIFERNNSAVIRFIETGKTVTTSINGTWEFDSTQEFIFLDTPDERYELRILRLKQRQLWFEYETTGNNLIRIQLN